MREVVCFPIACHILYSSYNSTFTYLGTPATNSSFPVKAQSLFFCFFVYKLFGRLQHNDIIIIYFAPIPHPHTLILGDLPPVILEGNHDRLKVVVYLPPSQYSSLPDEILTSTAGIKIHTVLFNKGKLLPARASEQGNVIGLVSMYIYIYICHQKKL